MSTTATFILKHKSGEEAAVICPPREDGLIVQASVLYPDPRYEDAQIELAIGVATKEQAATDQWPEWLVLEGREEIRALRALLNSPEVIKLLNQNVPCSSCGRPTDKFAEERVGGHFDPAFPNSQIATPYTMPVYCEDCAANIVRN